MRTSEVFVEKKLQRFFQNYGVSVRTRELRQCGNFSANEGVNNDFVRTPLMNGPLTFIIELLYYNLLHSPIGLAVSDRKHYLFTTISCALQSIPA